MTIIEGLDCFDMKPDVSFIKKDSFANALLPLRAPEKNKSPILLVFKVRLRRYTRWHIFPDMSRQVCLADKLRIRRNFWRFISFRGPKVRYLLFMVTSVWIHI